jgi:hypothetical protein
MQSIKRITMRTAHTYRTRHLEAGHDYDFPLEEALALVAKRKADFTKPQAKKKEIAPAPVSELPPTVPRHELDDKRSSGQSLPGTVVPRHEPWRKR